MGRGPKKHLKRIRAPKTWMVKKMGGTFTYRPLPGPHKLRECIPLGLLLRYRLKYANTGREANIILNDKEAGVKIDNKRRKDDAFPVGVNDILTIEKTGENFRVMLDVKGRFVLKEINPDEAKWKLLRV